MRLCPLLGTTPWPKGEESHARQSVNLSATFNSLAVFNPILTAAKLGFQSYRFPLHLVELEDAGEDASVFPEGKSSQLSLLLDVRESKEDKFTVKGSKTQNLSVSED